MQELQGDSCPPAPEAEGLTGTSLARRPQQTQRADSARQGIRVADGTGLGLQPHRQWYRADTCAWAQSLDET